MRITDISASTHRIPVNVPLLNKPAFREVVLARIQTDSSATGYGLAAGIQRRSVAAFLNHEVGPFLRGADVSDWGRLWLDLYGRFNQRGYSGVIQMGLSAVDIAVWDIRGKLLGQPVWRLLGGVSKRVPVYITFGLLDYSASQLAEAARALVAEGFRRLKMVVGVEGGRNVAEDATRVRAVRDAVGDDVALAVDGNQLFDRAQARELCRRIEPWAISWFEEPIVGNDVVALADLRRHTRIPLSAGQNEGHKWRHRDLIVSGAIDLAQPNVLFVGGYTEAVKVAHLAEAFSLPVTHGGGWPFHNAHLLAAIGNAGALEFHIPTWRASEVIYTSPPAPTNGEYALTEAVGLGLEPREDALREYAEESTP